MPKKSFPPLHLGTRPAGAVSTRGQGLPDRWCKPAPSRCKVRVPAHPPRRMHDHAHPLSRRRSLSHRPRLQGSEALTQERCTVAFDICALTFMLLTRAAIHHWRLIPQLAHKGFRGCVPGTAAGTAHRAVRLRQIAEIRMRVAMLVLMLVSQAVPASAQSGPPVFVRSWTRAGFRRKRSGSTCKRSARPARCSPGTPRHP